MPLYDENLFLRDLRGRDFVGALQHTVFDYYRPSVSLSLWFVQLFSPDGYYHHRLVNLFLHFCASLLVSVWSYRRTGNWTLSVLAGSLFGSTPMHADEAAWISSRGDTIATIGMLLTLMAAEAKKPILIGLSFLLALSGKEAAAFGIIPVGLLGGWRVALACLPAFCITAIARIWIDTSPGGFDFVASSFLTVVSAPGLALGKTIMPLDLSTEYGFYPEIRWVPFIILGFSVLVIWLGREPRMALTFMILVFPSPFSPALGHRQVVDGFWYLPSAIAYVSAAGFFSRWVRSINPATRRLASVGAAVLLIGTSLLSYEFGRNYRSLSSLLAYSVDRWDRAEGSIAPPRYASYLYLPFMLAHHPANGKPLSLLQAHTNSLPPYFRFPGIETSMSRNGEMRSTGLQSRVIAAFYFWSSPDGAVHSERPRHPSEVLDVSRVLAGFIRGGDLTLSDTSDFFFVFPLYWVTAQERYDRQAVDEALRPVVSLRPDLFLLHLPDAAAEARRRGFLADPDAILSSLDGFISSAGHDNPGWDASVWAGQLAAMRLDLRSHPGLVE